LGFAAGQVRCHFRFATKIANAYASGSGPGNRVVLWDTTLSKLNGDETLLVLGHEIGHYALHHKLFEIAKEFLNNTFCLRGRNHTTSNQVYYTLGAAFPFRYCTHLFRLVQFRVVHNLGLSIENTRWFRDKRMFPFVQDDGLVLPRLKRSDVYDQHFILVIWVGNDYPEMLFFT
jgi:hypothetical protein